MVHAATQVLGAHLRGGWHTDDRRSARDWQVQIATQWNTDNGGTPGHRHYDARPYIFVWERRGARYGAEVDARRRDGGTTTHLDSRDRTERRATCDGDDKTQENKSFHVLPSMAMAGAGFLKLHYHPNAD